MTQILPHPLWLGHAGDGRDFRQLFEAGIQASVQLAAEEPDIQVPRELIHVHIPLLDGPGNRAELLALAIRTVAALLALRVPTLVWCGAGLSRSPSIAAAALAMTSGEPLGESLRRIGEHRPCDVSPGLWKDVIDLSAPRPIEGS
jgi:protein-tyrosine phosphatase